MGDIAPRITASPYGYALVTSTTGVILGRLRASALDVAPDTPVEQAMEPGPSTVRPDLPAEELAQRLRDKKLRTAILTTPEGTLIGVARGADLEHPRRAG